MVVESMDELAASPGIFQISFSSGQTLSLSHCWLGREVVHLTAMQNICNGLQAMLEPVPGPQTC